MYFFGKPKIGFVGFWLTCNGDITLNKKSEAMNNMTPLNLHQEFCKFIGLVYYYRDIWSIHSHTL